MKTSELTGGQLNLFAPVDDAIDVAMRELLNVIVAGGAHQTNENYLAAEAKLNSEVKRFFKCRDDVPDNIEGK